MKKVSKKIFSGLLYVIHRLIPEILPSTCVLCFESTQASIDLCLDCEKDLPWIGKSCKSCANPLPVDYHSPQLCGQCLKENHPFHLATSVFLYTAPIDQFIIQLKFHQKLVYSKILSQLLAKKLKTVYSSKEWPEVIIPVPSHKYRLRERGFSQAVDLARNLSHYLKIPMDYKICIRQRYTPAQIGLPLKERAQNVRNAFLLTKNCTYRYIVILDDVITTGSTVKEIKKIFEKAGVKKIDLWSCARAGSHPES